MIYKYALVFILCFNLAFSTNAYADFNSSPLSILLDQHREIKTGVGSMEMVTKHGKALVETTAKLMSDPKNKDFLSTQEGLELQKHQELLNNFLVLKDTFEKCVKDKTSKRKLDERVLQASFQELIKLDEGSPCLIESSNFSSAHQALSLNVLKVTKTLMKPDFEGQMAKKILSNTAKSLLAFRQKFHPNFMRDGKLSGKEAQSLIDEVCVRKIVHGRGAYNYTDACPKLGPEFKSELNNELLKFSRTLSTNEKLTPQKATTSLNSAIDRLNTTLSKINVKKDVGHIYDSADLSDEESKKSFDTYVGQYMGEISKDAGSLLLTKTMKDAAGSIKSFKEDDTDKNKKTSKFQFSAHKKIKVRDVEFSIKEAEDKMLRQARDTLDTVIQPPKDSLQELVKINPFAMGQVLIHQPQYSALACEGINQANQTDSDDEQTDKYFSIGMGVVGGALLLTGVGTVAGAWLITGSLSAGVATGTVGGTILGYTALAGSAYEIANVGYSGKKSYDQYEEMNRLESSYLTQNNDQAAILEAKDALVEFKEARLSAGISLAGTGLSLFSAGKLFNILKTTDAKVSPDQIKAASKIMQYLGESQIAKRLKETTQVLGIRGAEKADQFFYLLSQSSEKLRMKMLESLKNSSFTPQKMKEVFENALEAAKNCEKT